MTKSLPKSKPWQLRLDERRTLLVLGDLLAALLALVLALYLWGRNDPFLPFGWTFLQRRVPAWFFLLPLAWLLLLIEQYDMRRAGDWRGTVRGVLTASMMGLGLYLVLFFYYIEPQRMQLPRLGVAVFVATVTALTLLWRRTYIQVFTAPHFRRKSLLVGGGETGRVLLQVVNQIASHPLYIVGVIDDDPSKHGTQLEGYPILGGCDQLERVILQEGITDVIVAITGEMQGTMFQSLLDAQEKGVDIIRMPVAYEELLGRVPIRLLEADWILRSFVDQSRVGGFFELFKRLLDIVGALVGLAGMLLILPLVALAIWLDNGLPVFYGQIRAGRGGQPYRILKFRTMRNDAEADGQPQWAKEDDERATRVGRILRRTHIDELPQFWNVLRGEMSLVGPRAERPELVAMYQNHVPFYRARLLVKPGITGWAQVNFGYAMTIEETILKLEYDLYYIKHRNVSMELLILLRTPATMLGLKGR